MTDSIWTGFANLLGIEERHAEDALHSERVAKHVVSRRSFLGAAGALAGATLFSFAAPAQAEVLRIESTGRSIGGSRRTQFNAFLLKKDDYVFIGGDTQNFEIGEAYQIGFGDGKKPATQLVVSAVDRERGIITFDDNFWGSQ